MSALRVLSLFAGIGGIDLGLERAGMRVVAHSEIEPYACRVLAKHWPDAPNLGDVTAIDWSSMAGKVDVIAGGFPCQPFSWAGHRKGVADERWMWPWVERGIRLLRPRYVILENVAALIRDPSAFGAVLGDLARIGFDAEWTVLTACAVGAPHARRRVFIVAYPNAIDGLEGLGSVIHGPAPIQPIDHRSRSWRDPDGGFMEAAGDLDRVADGVPHWMDRLRGLGNAVVPQAAEHIGRIVVAHHEDAEARR